MIADLISIISSIWAIHAGVTMTGYPCFIIDIIEWRIYATKTTKEIDRIYLCSVLNVEKRDNFLTATQTEV